MSHPVAAPAFQTPGPAPRLELIGQGIPVTVGQLIIKGINKFALAQLGHQQPSFGLGPAKASRVQRVGGFGWCGPNRKILMRIFCRPTHIAKCVQITNRLLYIILFRTESWLCNRVSSLRFENRVSNLGFENRVSNPRFENRVSNPDSILLPENRVVK